MRTTAAPPPTRAPKTKTRSAHLSEPADHARDVIDAANDEGKQEHDHKCVCKKHEKLGYDHQSGTIFFRLQGRQSLAIVSPPIGPEHLDHDVSPPQSCQHHNTHRNDWNIQQKLQRVKKEWHVCSHASLRRTSFSPGKRKPIDGDHHKHEEGREQHVEENPCKLCAYYFPPVARILADVTNGKVQPPERSNNHSAHDNMRYIDNGTAKMFPDRGSVVFTVQ